MRVLGLLNLAAGLFLFFALSGIAEWDWFPTREAASVVFVLSMVMVGNGLWLGFTQLTDRRSS
jgi:hypothetical protein